MKITDKIWILPLIAILLIAGGSAFAQDELDAEGVIRIFDRLAQFAIFVGMALIVIYIVLAGIKIATAGGDMTRYQEGKDGLKWGLIGAVVILGVYVIINTIKNIVSGSYI
jgi:hypothetical protein